MRRDGYPSEKFYLAVDGLAKSPRPLQKRIADAFSYSLSNLSPHHLDKLPERAREKLQQYEAAWHTVDDPDGEGLINVWASRLSDDEAIEIASWIVETAFELHREFWSAASRGRD